MRMGILIVIHTFGADMKWHPHIYPVEFHKGNPIQQGELAFLLSWQWEYL